ncbi:hypothetical protein D3C80_2017760 [compost metagenome]
MTNAPEQIDAVRRALWMLAFRYSSTASGACSTIESPPTTMTVSNTRPSKASVQTLKPPEARRL